MREVSKRLLAVHKHQFETLEEQKAAEADFKAAWRSSKIVLDALEVSLELQLNQLIRKDEDEHNTELSQPDIKHWYNIGSRKTVRYVLNQLLKNVNINTGDK